MSQTATALVTAEMLQPMVDGITANVKAIVPVGMTVLGIMAGIKVIPAIIYKFL